MMRLNLSALCVALLLGSAAIAQEPIPVDETVQADPPERVARLSFLSGDVSFEAADSGKTEAAVINRPVTYGDRIFTGNNSRSELTMGVAAVRLDERTELLVADLDDGIVQLDVKSGVISVHIRELEPQETFEVDVPNAAIRLMTSGDYRIEVPDNGPPRVVVHSGEASIDNGTGSQRLRSGEQTEVLDGGRLAGIERAGRLTSFDRWSQDREQQLNGREAVRYVSRDVVGYEDLDSYGSWYSEPEYGWVWRPRLLVTGWAPYRYGRWTWISPWGWTWIDNSPWGYAPFHYGRWAYVRSNWCWVPGPRHIRAVYAPALVGWVGGPQIGVSFAIGSGPVSWFPLGPREVYVPWHRSSPRYIRQVNISNTIIINQTDITNAARHRNRGAHYANRGAPNALSSAPRENFRGWEGQRERSRPGTRSEFSHSGSQNPGFRGAEFRDGRRSSDNDRDRFIRERSTGTPRDRNNGDASRDGRNGRDNNGNNDWNRSRGRDTYGPDTAPGAANGNTRKQITVPDRRPDAERRTNDDVNHRGSSDDRSRNSRTPDARESRGSWNREREWRRDSSERPAAQPGEPSRDTRRRSIPDDNRPNENRSNENRTWQQAPQQQREWHRERPAARPAPAPQQTPQQRTYERRQDDRPASGAIGNSGRDTHRPSNNNSSNNNSSRMQRNPQPEQQRSAPPPRQWEGRRDNDGAGNRNSHGGNNGGNNGRRGERER